MNGHDDYVLDVTFGDTELACFCPIEADSTVVIGLSILTDRCPGKLVGVYHGDGQEAAEAWCAAHPNWYQEFK